MSRTRVAIPVMISILFCLVSAAPAGAEDVSWSPGDWWEYSWGAAEEGMFTMNGSVTMTVGQSSSDNYVIALSGTATASGTFMNVTVEGNVSISGTIIRSKANFAAVSTVFMIDAPIIEGLLSVQVGMSTSATPPLDDLPIKRSLIPGSQIWSNSTITGVSWMNIGGLTNNTTAIDGTQNIMMIAGANETVTTPAGTFECVKLSTAPGPDAVAYYYSQKVGNYVKMSATGGLDIGYSGLGNLTLEDYSFGKDGGIISFITGENWWVTAVMVVVVIAVVVVVMVLRRRGRESRVGADLEPRMPPSQPPQG